MTGDFSFLDRRPIIVALAGSNGAGKTTFYHAHLVDSGLRFVNADVPDEKLMARFERTRANLQRAIEQLPHVIIFDNSDLAHPYSHVATYQHGKSVEGEGN